MIFKGREIKPGSILRTDIYSNIFLMFEELRSEGIIEITVLLTTEDGYIKYKRNDRSVDQPHATDGCFITNKHFWWEDEYLPGDRVSRLDLIDE